MPTEKTRQNLLSLHLCRIIVHLRRVVGWRSCGFLLWTRNWHNSEDEEEELRRAAETGHRETEDTERVCPPHIFNFFAGMDQRVTLITLLPFLKGIASREAPRSFAGPLSIPAGKPCDWLYQLFFTSLFSFQLVVSIVYHMETTTSSRCGREINQHVIIHSGNTNHVPSQIVGAAFSSPGRPRAFAPLSPLLPVRRASSES